MSPRVPTRQVRIRPDAAPRYHPVYVRLLVAAAVARGIERPRLLAAAGLDETAIGAAAAPIGHRTVATLVAAVRAVCPDPCLALEWGTRVRDNVHGSASTAFFASRDLRQALGVLPELAASRTTAVRLRLIEDQDYAWIEAAEAAPLGAEREFLLAAVSVVVMQLLVAITGDSGADWRLELPLAERVWRAGCAASFCGVLSFAALRLRVGLPRVLLDQPCATADQDTHTAALRQCALEAAGRSERVATRIAALLALHSGPYPTLAAMARRFCISPRSLSRALHDEGTTYQTMLDAARSEAAQRYLRDTLLSIDAIAERVGFADTSNFIRAFRRWCGATPLGWRESARMD